MRFSRTLPCLLLLCCSFSEASAQAPGDAAELDVASRVESVVVYRGRAAVTRRATLALQPGIFELRFSGLPETIQPETLQARGGDSIRVLGVDFEVSGRSPGADPEIAALDQRIAELENGITDRSDRIALVEERMRLVSEIGVRVTAEAREDAGSDALDLESLDRQLEFVAKRQEELLERKHALASERRELAQELEDVRSRREARAGASGRSRAAIVTVAVNVPGDARITLLYLVTEATWTPAYNVRAAADGSNVQIEYDALISQRTGEHWQDIALTLSTAQPALASHPPDLSPWFVDVVEPGTRFSASEPAREKADAALRSAGRPADEVEVRTEGPNVTFTLPRRVTIDSNARRQQRTRITTLDSSPAFVHMAVPVYTDAAYVRTELINNTDSLLLPGSASIFMGQDYIGRTELDTVSPGGRFEVFFGIDPAVRVVRRLISKTTTKTGLLGGGRRTSYEYRVEIENGTAQPLTLELWDRIPVSRSDQIQIDLVSPSQPLDTDTAYTENDRPRGLLKWTLDVPADARGSAATVLTYGVRVNRAKELDTTPLPE